MFTRDEVHWFSDTVRKLYSAENSTEFVHAAITSVYTQFRLCSSACEEIGVGASSYVQHGLRCEVPPPPDHQANFHDCPFLPVVSRERIPPVLHMRQQVSLTTWARTDHFNGIARPMGWCDHLCLVGQTKPTLFLMGLQRDTVFSFKEHELIRHLQPHIAAVWFRVRPCGRESEWGSLRIMLSPQLRPYGLSEGQYAILHAYFPAWRESGTLPAELHSWILRSLAKLQHDPPQPVQPFTVESARGRLLARCFPAQSGGGVRLILIETPPNPDFFRLRAAGLTSRECEVLHWLARGKRDAEIAVITGTAPKTAGKHVEHVLAKLQAGSRAAAVSIAREQLRSGS